MARDKKSRPVDPSQGPEPTPALAQRLAELSGEAPALGGSTRSALMESVQSRELLHRFRSWSSGQQFALQAGLSLIISLIVLSAMRRIDFPSYPAARMGIALLLLTIAGAGALKVAMRPLHISGIPPGARTIALLFALFAPLGLALLPDAHSGELLHLHGEKEMWISALRCLLFGLITGAPLLLASWLISRTGLRTIGTLLMAALGAVVLGNFTLQLHCPVTEPLHLLLGHAGVLLPFALFAGVAWVRRRT
jgi:hypothetical protein